MQHVSRLLESMGRYRPPRFACEAAMEGTPARFSAGREESWTNFRPGHTPTLARPNWSDSVERLQWHR